MIGNASYAKDVLRNPVNDANDIANILEKQLGFTVILAKNGDRRAMHKAVQQFKAKLSANTEVAFFFYSGHGAQFMNDSYLLPLGANIVSTADLPIEALKAKDILAQMQSSGSRVNVMVLDACRNLPAYIVATKGREKGLGRINIVI